MHYLFYKVRSQDIYMIKFLVEGYENMMEISTIDKEMGKIQITIAPDFLKDCQNILDDLSQQFTMIPLNEPHHVSQGNY